ncbi:hypothetical protein L596_004791 [Steinernema carpocapsae]|uniref:Uncharacterized protein n=1 Tax=Steinernema carpocapsae TaxID=34508 RepID=A0A4U8UWW1_STECR|nr:hypothetical protein L596_004791 [Steinernema carpocapsae]
MLFCVFQQGECCNVAMVDHNSKKNARILPVGVVGVAPCVAGKCSNSLYIWLPLPSLLPSPSQSSAEFEHDCSNSSTLLSPLLLPLLLLLPVSLNEA